MRIGLVLVLAVGGRLGCAQDILTNGGFGDGLFSGVGGVMVLNNGSMAIEGWQVLGGTSGGIEWLTTNNLYGYELGRRE